MTCAMETQTSPKVKSLSQNRVEHLEGKAAIDASSEYYGKKIAGEIKRASLKIFIWSMVIVFAFGAIDLIISLIFDKETTTLFKAAFEVAKTITLTLLGFTFANKLDDLLK